MNKLFTLLSVVGILGMATDAKATVWIQSSNGIQKVSVAKAVKAEGEDPVEGDTIVINEVSYKVGKNLITNPSFDKGFEGWYDGNTTSLKGTTLTSVNWKINPTIGVDGNWLQGQKSQGMKSAGSLGTAWQIEKGKTYFFGCYTAKAGQKNLVANLGYQKISLTNTIATETEVIFGSGGSKGNLAYKDKWTYNYAVIDNSVKGYKYLQAFFRWEQNGAIGFDRFILAELTRLDGGTGNYNQTLKSAVELKTPEEYHIISDIPFDAKGSINIANDRAVLVVDSVKPSLFKQNYLSHVLINGAAAKDSVNCRVDIFNNGTIVYPHSKVGYKPLTVYTEKNFGGNSTNEWELFQFYNGLGEYTNTIKSIKLKRGYMATLACNSDGTGYSKVFIAQDGDLEISDLGKLLGGKVDFIRVFPWRQVAKKGLGGAKYYNHLFNATWSWNWGASNIDFQDEEYVPSHEQENWPSWSSIMKLDKQSHLLGHCEPDNKSGENITVAQIEDKLFKTGSWQRMYQTGMRVGSPAPGGGATSETVWLDEFMRCCKKYNCRIDYIVVHKYWYANGSSFNTDMNNLYSRYKRPIWITEWNYGGNWTKETWPDADRTGTEKNYAHELAGVKSICEALEKNNYVERYSIYNWVQDCRKIYNEKDSTITPAGKYYAALKSKTAYRSSVINDEDWTYNSPEGLKAAWNKENKKVTLSWQHLNGKQTDKITVERQVEDGKFEVVATFGMKGDLNMSYDDDINDIYGEIVYRIHDYDSDGKDRYSELVKIQRDKVPAKPVARACSGNAKVTVAWEQAFGVAYRIYRSEVEDGTYQLIADEVNGSPYVDANLQNGKTYYYKVTPFNSLGNGTTSEVLAAKPADGQYLHFAFDENEGLTAYDEWGGYTGSLENKASWGEGQKESGAVAVAKSNSAYVALSKDIVKDLDALTLSTWVKFGTSMVRLFDFGTGTTNFMMCKPGSANLRYKMTCAKGVLDKTFPCTINQNEWTHIAISQSADSLSMYVNGEWIGTIENTAKVTPKDLGGTDKNYLGRSMWASDAYSDVTYDDLKIYDKVLTAEEVKKQYESERSNLSTRIIIQTPAVDKTQGKEYNLRGMAVSKNAKGIHVSKNRKYYQK